MVKNTNFSRQISPRHLGVVPNTPEREAVESGAYHIKVTYGHIATKLYEVLLADGMSEDEAMKIVNAACPADRRTEMLDPMDGPNVELRTLNTLNNINHAPILELHDELWEQLQDDFDEFITAASQRENQSVSVREFLSFLETLPYIARLTKEERKTVFTDFAHHIQSGYWIQQIDEDGNLSEEFLNEEQLHANAVHIFVNSFCDTQIREFNNENIATSHRIRDQVRPIYLVTSETVQQVRKLFPGL